MLQLGGAAAPLETEEQQATSDDQARADSQAGEDVAAGERQVADAAAGSGDPDGHHGESQG